MEDEEATTEPTIASQVPFHDFAMVCEKISKTQGKDKKKTIMKKFIDHWRSAHNKMHAGKKTVCTLVYAHNDSLHLHLFSFSFSVGSLYVLQISNII